MQITDIKVFMKEGQDKKLKAYATITLDNCFVVRNIKVIDGNKGLFVAMPSRKIKDPCPKCHFRNTVRSKFCNLCGASLPQDIKPRSAAPGEDVARQSEHKDIAHPITIECREYIQKKVLEAYDMEKTRTPQARQEVPAQAPQARQEVPPQAPQAAPAAQTEQTIYKPSAAVHDDGDDIEL